MIERCESSSNTSWGESAFMDWVKNTTYLWQFAQYMLKGHHAHPEEGFCNGISEIKIMFMLGHSSTTWNGSNCLTLPWWLSLKRTKCFCLQNYDSSKEEVSQNILQSWKGERNTCYVRSHSLHLSLHTFIYEMRLNCIQ